MASEDGKQATSQAKATHDVALGDATNVWSHFKALEDELQGLRDELAKEVRDRQEKEKEMKTREDVVGDRDTELDELVFGWRRWSRR